jgi:plastocyanin
MFVFRKLVIMLVCVACLGSVRATTFNVKTIGQEFVSDTIYATIGDTVHFIISMGHDAQEITLTSYNSNVFDAFPGGFNYPDGSYDFVVDSVKTYYYACSYHLASSQMKGVIISTAPMANEESNVRFSGLFCYPNPVTDFINVVFDDPTSHSFLRITNLKGNTVFDQDLFFPQQINLSYLNKGFYFLHVKTEEQTQVKLIIKN